MAFRVHSNNPVNSGFESSSESNQIQSSAATAWTQAAIQEAWGPPKVAQRRNEDVIAAADEMTPSTAMNVTLSWMRALGLNPGEYTPEQLAQFAANAAKRLGGSNR